MWKTGNYTNDVKEGEWSFFSETKVLVMKGKFKNGKEEGEWLSWYDSGKKKDVGHFTAGLMNGKWEGWFENEKKDYEGEYKNGLKDGVWQHWYDNGKQELMQTFLVKTVESKEYLKESEKRFAEFNKSQEISVLDGPHFSWYENGQPKEEGAYLNNVQHGKWTYYYDDGKKMYEQTFENGRQNGTVTSWYPEGPIESIKMYKNFVPDGKWIYYEKQAGKIKGTVTYKDGVKIPDAK